MVLLPKPVVLTGQSRHGGVHGNVREKGGVGKIKEEEKKSVLQFDLAFCVKRREREREREGPLLRKTQPRYEP